MKHFRIFIMAVLTGILTGISLPGYADDTEIYTQASQAYNQFSRPNILFVLDRSGSMGYDNPTRMSVLKEALLRLLDPNEPQSLQNVNVGIQSFSDRNYGNAPIRFPIAFIDAEAGTVGGGAGAAAIRPINVPVKAADDDAEEYTDSLTSAQVLTINQTDSTLDLTTVQDANAVGGSGGDIGTIDWPSTKAVSQGNHDSDEQGNGSKTNEPGSTDIDLGMDSSGRQLIGGVMFSGLDIPQDTTISDAKITLTERDGNSGDIDLEVFVVNRIDPPVFNGSNGHISNPSNYPLGSSVVWEIRERWDDGGQYTTPNLAALVQSQVSDPGWNNQIAFLIKYKQHYNGDSSRRNRAACSYNHSSCSAPVLEISYPMKGVDARVSSGTDDTYERWYKNKPNRRGLNELQLGRADDKEYTVGLRFRNLSIPQGAQITDAFIDVKSGDGDGGDLTLLISSVAKDHTGQFSGNNDNISKNYPMGESSVTWAITDDWANNAWYTTPDIRTLVQEVVSRPGWSSGNAMTFLFKYDSHSGDDDREISARNDGPNNAPILRVTWSGGGSLEQRIQNNKDDADERVEYINNHNDSSNGIVLGEHSSDGGDVTTAGLRFSNMGIPPETPIENAFLEFTEYHPHGDLDDGGNNIDLDIYARAQNTPAAFTSDRAHIDSHYPRSGTSVRWEINETWVHNSTYKSPELKTLVQAIVDDPGWSNDDSIVFLLQSDDSSDHDRRGYSYELSPTKAPRLVIKVGTTGGGGETPVINEDIGSASNIAVEWVGGPDVGDVILGSASAHETNLRLGSGWCDADVGCDNVGLAGLRFTNGSTDVPAGSIITSAKIEFTRTASDENSSGTANVSDDKQLNLKIQIQDTASNSTFGGGTAAPSARTKAVDAGTQEPLFAAWVNVPVLADGNTLTTPDLSGLVQAVIGNAGWAQGQSLVFLIEPELGIGSRAFQGIAAGETPPRFTLEWGSLDTSARLDQQVGVRFQDVNLPNYPDAITNAYIKFTGAAADGRASNVNISAHKVANSATFSPNEKVSDKMPRTSTVAWNAISPWSAGQVYQTADVTGIVKEILGLSNNTAWCGGNAMTFIFETLNGSPLRRALSFEGGDGTAPVLHVEYDTSIVLNANQAICMKETTSHQIASSTDDTEERGDGQVFNDSAWLGISQTDALTFTTGLRFPDVPISKDSEILEVKLIFTAIDDNVSYDEQLKAAASWTIRGELSNNASPFNTGANELSNRTWTAASAGWSHPAGDPKPWVHGESYVYVSTLADNPGFVSVIQEIVSQAGWQTNNDLALFITGSGLRRAYSFEGGQATNPLNAPKLVITYNPMTSTGDGDGSGSGDSGGFGYNIREKLTDIVENDLVIGGYTPLVDTLYEAGQYFVGGEVVYGKDRGNSGSSQEKKNRVSHPASHDGTITVEDGCTDQERLDGVTGCCSETNLGASACKTEAIEPSQGQGNKINYIEPSGNACASNHIVFLSDGQPTGNDAAGKVKSLVGGSCVSKYPETNSIVTSLGGYYECGVDMAKYLHDEKGIQVHTIAYYLDEDDKGAKYLKAWAHAGGGVFKSADSADELLDAFTTIVGAAMTDSTSFAAPTLSVNAFSRLFHNDEIYFAMFKPERKRAWAGNVKKYRLRGCNGDDCSELALVEDREGNVAVETEGENEGKIKDTAYDLWNPLAVSSPAADNADGSTVTKGGAGSRIPTSANRTIWTNINNVLVKVDTLDSSANSLLGVTNDADREKVIDWIYGTDVQDEDQDGNTTEEREWRLGDPLHAKPGVITYGEAPGSGSCAQEAVGKVFVATNEGAVRMLNACTGEEEWMFIPKDMLAIQQNLMTNSVSITRQYGLDGTPTFLINDVNGNGIIESGAGGDYVHLFVGMRRGGHNIYALDVTPASTLTNHNGTGASPSIDPEFKWAIKGGSGAMVENSSVSEPAYNALGQTWSLPGIAYVMVDNVSKPVLAFAGGYHTNYDTATAQLTDAEMVDGGGNAIYLADPADGSVLWWASSNTNANCTSDTARCLALPKMTYAIPSDLMFMDTTDDAHANRIYVGDMGGQMWRIDLNGLTPDADNKGIGGVLASIGHAKYADDIKHHRRFFYAPDVVSLRDPDHSLNAYYDLVLAGTGHRNHPLGVDTLNRFYAFRDFRVVGRLVDKERDENGLDGIADEEPAAFQDHKDSAGNDVVYEDNTADNNYFGGHTDFFALTHAYLYDATDHISTPSSSGTQVTIEDIVKLQKSRGWYLDLVGSGEKALAEALVLGGKVYFTTYVPDNTSAQSGGADGSGGGANQGSCASPGQGQGQGPSGGGNSDKPAVCHYPPGNPDNHQCISADQNAWPAHWAHGDLPANPDGTCPTFEEAQAACGAGGEGSGWLYIVDIGSGVPDSIEDLGSGAPAGAQVVIQEGGMSTIVGLGGKIIKVGGGGPGGGPGGGSGGGSTKKLLERIYWTEGQ
ncbi:MAG: hypothetical protein GY862_13595 [Gammaproteobacteria bacterium]|nr:hypothetical protein [Gammaproteobacteria bacterium]